MTADHDAGRPVDARGAIGVQFGDNAIQNIYTYDERTWSDRVLPPPLVDVAGVIDSPYRGLGAFDERDSAFFFGRDSTAAEVLALMSRRLNAPSLVVVSGVSGAGKSSLIRAGVLPRMRAVGLADTPGSTSWPCLVFTPGPAPLDQLAVGVAPLIGAHAGSVRHGLGIDPARFALDAAQIAMAGPSGSTGAPVRSPHRRMLLVVDQFEQVFTQCPDERQRQAFITALHAAASAGHGSEQVPAALVVLVVRADFEARCADYPQLTAAVRDRYLVTSMTQRQLRLAITEPAKKAGSRVDDDLVETLLREMRTRSPSGDGRGTISAAGVLPLLSHALDQAWRRRVGAVLTVPDYERAGGVERAVAESADRAYDRLSPTQQAAARQVFIRLTATNSEGVDTADRVDRTELTQGATAADVHAVLESFAAERLLTLAAGTVEISHEVLLSAWPLLRDTWLAETDNDRIVRTRLRTTAAEWGRTGNDPSYLYAGSLLDTATDTADRVASEPARQPPLSPDEQAFLRASSRARRRRARLRQTVMAFLTVLVVGLAAVTVVAYRAGRDAAQQRDLAVARQLVSQSLELGATDPTAARQESLAAWGINPTSEARYAMLAAEALPTRSIFTVPGGLITKVAFSANGAVLATDSVGAAELWNVATGRQIGQLGGPGDYRSGNNLRRAGPVWDMAFSPAGKAVATADVGGAVRLWDMVTGYQTGQLTGDTGDPTSLAFSPDGRTLATVGLDHIVRLWNVASGRQIGQLPSPDRYTISVSFSPDGRTLAVTYVGKVRLWDIATRHQIDQFTDNGDPDQPISFSPDGRTVAVIDLGTVQLWDVATGHQVGQPLTVPGALADAAAFSPDGTTLATATDDGTVVLWDLATGRQIGQPLTGPSGSVTSMAFAPDGRTLATGGINGTADLWNVAAGHEIGRPLTGHTNRVVSVAFSPGGRTLATAGVDGTARLWDVATGRQIGRLVTTPDSSYEPVAFSPDGETLVTSGRNGAATLWDVATGHQIGQFAGSTKVSSVAFSPDGTTLATASIDRTVRLWDVATRRQIGRFSEPTTLLTAITFSPDGRTLAIAGSTTVELWDVATGRQIFRPIKVNVALLSSVVFSPDGATLAIATDDGTVQLWDVATRREVSRPVTSYTGTINAVVFSPDGRTLATAGSDGTARLWDVATGREIGQPLTSSYGPLDEVNAVAFSPDGTTLATAGNDYTARLWDVGYLVDVLPRLCGQVGGSPTPATWARYVPPGPAYRRVCP